MTKFHGLNRRREALASAMGEVVVLQKEEKKTVGDGVHFERVRRITG